MHSTLIRHGFILILLSLIGAFFIPAMTLPGLALSAHTIGILAGVLLIAVGAVWAQFSLSRGLGRVLAVSWAIAGYFNWLGCLFGAMFGAGRTTPIASAGASGPGWAEALSGSLLMVSAAAAVVAVLLSIYGLRSKSARQIGKVE